MSTGDFTLDNESAAALLESAYFSDAGTDVLDARPEAVERAEQDGFKPLLRLSQGPVSEVWRCVDRGSMMDVVIKSVRQESLATAEEAQAWLRQEAQVLGRLKGTGAILPLRQVSAGWSSYLALPYINGESITTHCRLRGLDLGQRLRVFARCIDCVAKIHERGVVHGDLKPDHLLIDFEAGDTPAVIDFGLATQRELTSASVSGRFNIGGTAPYTAPEIAKPDCRPDPTQDVYSLGVILSELLGDADLALQHNELGKVIRIATADAPDARYTTARELNRDLSPILSSARRAEGGSHASTHAAHLGGSGRMGKPIFAVGFLCVTSVLAILLAGTYDAIRGGTADDQQSNAERSSPEDQSQTASMYPGLIGAAHMDPDGVRAEIAALAPSKTHYWEVRHAARAAAGTSTELPFGETPYQAPFAVTSCVHTETQTLAWANHLGEVWIRSAGRAASLLWRAQTAVLVKRIEFRADGHELLVVDSDGHLHFTPTVPAGELIERVVRTGLAAPMVAGYSESGDVAMVWRAEKSVIETWGPDDEVGPSGVRQQRDIDFACLSERPGYLGFMRRSDGDAGQPARFEVLDPHGQLACKVTLPIAGRVTAFDYHTDLQRLFVGTSNGHILCFNVPEGSVAWSTYLGFSTPVAAVLAVPDEGRVFASMGQVHLLGLEDGTLIDQLGNPEEQAVGVARLYWDAEQRSITSCSPVAVHRWAAD